MAEADGRIDKNELSGFSTKVLTIMLKDRGLKCTGYKEALVNRLFNGWFHEIDDKEETAKGSTKTNPNYCCVPRCHNNYHTEGVSLHRIPEGLKRKHIRKLWIEHLETVRSNLIVSSNTRVCSDHFKKEDYDGKKLKPEAYPTEFPFTGPPIPKDGGKYRARGRARKSNKLEKCEQLNTIDSIEDKAVIDLMDIQDTKEGEISGNISKVPGKVDTASQTDIRQCFSCGNCGTEMPLVIDFGCQTVLSGLPDAHLKHFKRKRRKLEK